MLSDIHDVGVPAAKSPRPLSGIRAFATARVGVIIRPSIDTPPVGLLCQRAGGQIRARNLAGDRRLRRDLALLPTGDAVAAVITRGRIIRFRIDPVRFAKSQLRRAQENY